jgi:uncharacterized phage-associated protein
VARIFDFFSKAERKMREITVSDVAKAFLTIESMTPKKLQKLCYYAYAWYLTLHGEHLFKNNFQAWIHGPVDPDLYNEYREHGWREIPRVDELPNAIADRPEIVEFLEEVYDSYGHLDGDQLEYLTHQEDPWVMARGGLPPYEPSRNPIDDGVIVRYYSKVLQDDQD